MAHPVRSIGGFVAVAAIAALSIVSANHHAAASSGLRVQGNRLVDSSGTPVVLHGVNHSGSEYACIQGWGVFDGPVDAASIAAMAAWHINAVRVPLNEDCWLGINGAGVGGAAYQQAVSAYVTLLTQSGMSAIVDLHWNAPGTTKATGQQPMADEDHAPAFWTSVASTFKGNSNVIFDLYNEPYPQNNQSNATAWACWRDGCQETSQQGAVYQAAGMQQLVNTVRATGAGNVLLLDGIQWGGTIDNWLQYKPTDPLNNLAAGQHSYPFSACTSATCWNSTTATVAQQAPVVLGEVGQTDCKSDYLSTILPWMDQHNVSYVGWAWSPSFGCESLLTNYNGTPSSPYGQAFKDHLAGLATSNAPTAVNTAVPSAPATTAPSATSTSAPTAPPTATATATSAPSASLVSSSVSFSPAGAFQGGSINAMATLRNGGAAAVTLQNIVLAGRPPAGTNAGGPFDDFTGTGAITLVPGQTVTVQGARTFSATDPTGTWYAYLTYQTPDGAWHDTPTDSYFTLAAPPTATPAPSATTPPTATPSPTAVAGAQAAPSLLPFANNRGISSDSNPATANFDGVSYSYSANALAAAGVTAGSNLTVDGSTFSWPLAQPGTIDDVQAHGQILRFQASPSATKLAFLGAAAHGPSYGSATITYTDGTVQHMTLGMSDWTLNGNAAQPSFGNTVAVTTAYRNYAGGASSSRRTYVFYASVGLQAGKTVASVQLPGTVNQGTLALFAVALS